MVSSLWEEVGRKCQGTSQLSSVSLSEDEATLRRRGLLVAAVLFITGIVILTSKNGGGGRVP